MTTTDEPSGADPRGTRTAPELRLAASAARLCVVLALPAVGGGWLAAGLPGLIGAGLAALGMCALLWSSAAVLAVCARRGGAALPVGGYASFAGRLAVTTAVLAALDPVEGIDMPSLVITAIALVLAVLAYECWQVARTPDLHWLETDRGRGGAPRIERTRA